MESKKFILIRDLVVYNDIDSETSGLQR